MQVSKLRSPKNTYGWVRAEVLGALVNSVFLLALCFAVVVEAMQRLTTGDSAVNDPDTLLYVGIVGLVFNLIALALFNNYGASDKKSRPSPPAANRSSRQRDTKSVDKGGEYCWMLKVRFIPIKTKCHQNNRNIRSVWTDVLVLMGFGLLGFRSSWPNKANLFQPNHTEFTAIWCFVVPWTVLIWSKSSPHPSDVKALGEFVLHLTWHLRLRLQAWTIDTVRRAAWIYANPDSRLHFTVNNFKYLFLLKMCIWVSISSMTIWLVSYTMSEVPVSSGEVLNSWFQEMVTETAVNIRSVKPPDLKF